MPESVDAPALTAAGVRWNLSELYTGPLDPRLADDAATALARAEAFAAAFRGRVAGLDPPALREALVEYEAILELARRPGFYASLLSAADTQDASALDLEQRTSEQCTDVHTRVVFFELELTAIPDADFAVALDHPALKDYAHFLRMLRRFKPHVLSEAEERVLARKDLSGRAAFVQLYDELTGSLRFPVEIEGAVRDLTDAEAMALLHHPDRALRQRALTSFLDVYRAQHLPLTAVMNALLLDHRIECDMRRYTDLTAPTHLANEVEPAVMATMMDAVERHYPVIQEFLRVKARLLGLAKLESADVYAPIDAAPATLTYQAAREIILGAFGRFGSELADLARPFFDAGWTDAEVRPGKRHGAFCAALGPGHHPYILASHTGTTRDVATLAHEIGHGIHYQLARRQTFVNYDPPLVLAETASVFAEMLVTEHLLATAPDSATRRRILVETLDEMYGTVFRQHALTRFELAAHATRRERRLEADELCDLWWREQSRLFADTVALHPAYRYGWMYISHFIHSRFYCYSYPFGELLTLALFQRYREQGPAFAPQYLALLASGASTDPAALTARLGLDLTSPTFWDGGCAAIAGMVEELMAAC